jgi:hypothetical protein
MFSAHFTFCFGRDTIALTYSPALPPYTLEDIVWIRRVRRSIGTQYDCEVDEAGIIFDNEERRTTSTQYHAPSPNRKSQRSKGGEEEEEFDGHQHSCMCQWLQESKNVWLEQLCARCVGHIALLARGRLSVTFA